MVAEKKLEVNCPVCGFDSPQNLRFCGNCGTRLTRNAEPERFEGLASLHLATSLYLILSVAFNGLVQSTAILFIPYSASGILGMYASYSLFQRRRRRWVSAASVLAITIGFSSTFFLFILGLAVKGVIGPVWVIFLLTGWFLWKTRKSDGSSNLGGLVVSS